MSECWVHHDPKSVSKWVAADQPTEINSGSHISSICADVIRCVCLSNLTILACIFGGTRFFPLQSQRLVAVVFQMVFLHILSKKQSHWDENFFNTDKHGHRSWSWLHFGYTSPKHTTTATASTPPTARHSCDPNASCAQVWLQCSVEDQAEDINDETWRSTVQCNAPGTYLRKMFICFMVLLPNWWHLYHIRKEWSRWYTTAMFIWAW